MKGRIFGLHFICLLKSILIHFFDDIVFIICNVSTWSISKSPLFDQKGERKRGKGGRRKKKKKDLLTLYCKCSHTSLYAGLKCQC